MEKLCENLFKKSKRNIKRKDKKIKIKFLKKIFLFLKLTFKKYKYHSLAIYNSVRILLNRIIVNLRALQIALFKVLLVINKAKK